MIVDGLSEDLFDLDADVVVVGSGAAACAAAVTAATSRQDVVLLERADTFGGTTALSGAGAWIPNNSYLRADGRQDPKPDAMRFMCSLAHPQRFDPSHPTLGLPSDAYALIETYYDRAADAIDDLVAMGAAEFFSDPDGPDYHVEHPDNACPRGRLLRPPESKVGHHGGGPALVARMIALAERHGAVTRTGHRVTRLLRNTAGECVGVEVRAGLRTILVRARKGVVFGSGGFLHDQRLRDEHLMGPTYGGCAAASAVGDFVRIGIENGAQLGNMRHAWWYQVVLDHTLESSHTAGGLFMPFGDSMIQVNRYGHRVMNEKGPYNERGPVHFAWDGEEYRNRVLFAIYDDGVMNDPNVHPVRFPTPVPGEDVGYVISGGSVTELAANIDRRLEEVRSFTGGLRLHDDFTPNLAATIDRFNHFAERGVDGDFGRGSHTIRESWVGTERPGTKATMHPIDASRRLYCMLLVAGALDTKGGPKINTHAQVLDADGEPIAGLYGAGNCVASPTGQGYWGPGATIGCALVYGWIAGRAVVEEASKSLTP